MSRINTNEQVKVVEATSLDAVKDTSIGMIAQTGDGTYQLGGAGVWNPVDIKGGGGGSSDFETVTVTNKTGNTIYIEGVGAAGEAEIELANNASAQILAGKFDHEGVTALIAQLLIASASLISTGDFSPLGNWAIGEDSVGVVDNAFGLGTIGAPVVECYLYVYCEQNANIIIVGGGQS